MTHENLPMYRFTAVTSLGKFDTNLLTSEEWKAWLAWGARSNPCVLQDIPNYCTIEASSVMDAFRETVK